VTSIKRAFDLAVASTVILVGTPLWAAVALAVVLDTPGPVFHRAVRVGKGAQPFTMYKFRTMVTGASAHAPGITRKGDPRITRVGRVLRRSKLDEMPQLVNVVKGEMSIVGPRPEDPRYVAHYTPEQRGVLSIRPGMASPAFVKYRREEDILAAAGDQVEQTYLTHVMPDKLRLDLRYIEQQSFLGDLAILARAAMPFLNRNSEQVDLRS
jgi:lipopolysaccharide/colanic/teichoic acid biosynthesis glycosyltransferase